MGEKHCQAALDFPVEGKLNMVGRGESTCGCHPRDFWGRHYISSSANHVDMYSILRMWMGLISKL